MVGTLETPIPDRVRNDTLKGIYRLDASYRNILLRLGHAKSMSEAVLLRMVASD
jgi:hypothetical protein